MAARPLSSPPALVMPLPACLCPRSALLPAAAAPAQQQKIRIKLKSYWVDLLHDSVEKIREAASSTGASIAGPVPLPTRCPPACYRSAAAAAAAGLREFEQH